MKTFLKIKKRVLTGGSKVGLVSHHYTFYLTKNRQMYIFGAISRSVSLPRNSLIQIHLQPLKKWLLPEKPYTCFFVMLLYYMCFFTITRKTPVLHYF